MGVIEQREKALSEAISKLNKTYGKGTIMSLGENTVTEVKSVSTGSLGLDLALGIGGFPEGRIIEIYGPESSGKTTLTIHAIAEAQKAGGTALFIDAEHAFDKRYAENLGVNVDKLLISQPDSGEQALEVAEGMIRSGAVNLVVIDSVAALVPKAELEGEMGDSKMGLHARLMSQAMRKMTAIVSKTGCTVIFINQIRMKIGVVYGNPETTTGGNALKFYSSIRLEVRRSGKSLEDKDGVKSANRTKVKVVKNKLAPPFRETEFDIEFGKGISRVGEVVDFGVSLDIISKSGSWYAYRDVKIGQGRDNVKLFLLDNEEVMEEIVEKINQKIMQ